MNKFTKLYATYCIGMGLYGFNRGYRSNSDLNYLTIDKISGSIINGLVYSTPFINISPTYRLLNRLEIKYRNLEQDKYISNYQELNGLCKETI